LLGEDGERVKRRGRGRKRAEASKEGRHKVKVIIRVGVGWHGKRLGDEDMFRRC